MGNSNIQHNFNIEYAAKYGIFEAVLINHFQFWLIKNIANQTNIHDGRAWTFNSVKAFQEIFPYVSYDKVRRALDKLVNSGVLLTGNYNKSPMDRTLWYSLSDDFLPNVQNGQIHLAKNTNGIGENAEE